MNVVFVCYFCSCFDLAFMAKSESEKKRLCCCNILEVESVNVYY